MQTTNSKRIRTGIFTLIGILLFVAGIFLIGSKKNMFSDTYTIYGTFRNVGGLSVGNNIRFAGITVGTVEDISIVSDTMIRVDMLLKEEVRPFLKADALATIGSDGLMGDKLITISSGSANQVKLLTGGSRIRTADPVDFDRVITKLTAVADNAEIISGELAGMAIQLRSGNGTMSRLLYRDDLSKSLEGTMNNAQSITGSMAGIATQIRAGKGSVGSLLYTDSLSNGIEQAVTTANGAMVTIQKAADNFSENMKALQGNFLLRGYFKKKAKNAGNNLEEVAQAVDTQLDEDLNEAELNEIIAEAQKALEAKKKK